MGVFKSEDLTPVEWASHSARVWGEYQTPAGGTRHNFCFLLNPNAESTSLILFFFCDLWIALLLTHITVERGDIDSLTATHAHDPAGGDFALFPEWKSGTCGWKLWKLEGCWRSSSSSLAAGVPWQPVMLRAGRVCVFYLTMRGNGVWL